jgi:hypothetical protein
VRALVCGRINSNPHRLNRDCLDPARGTVRICRLGWGPQGRWVRSGRAMRGETSGQILTTPGCGKTKNRRSRKLPTKPTKAAMTLLNIAATPAATKPIVRP